jgi:uncharacterized protein (TIGR00296 family)
MIRSDETNECRLGGSIAGDDGKPVRHNRTCREGEKDGKLATKKDDDDEGAAAAAVVATIEMCDHCFDSILDVLLADEDDDCDNNHDFDYRSSISTPWGMGKLGEARRGNDENGIDDDGTATGDDVRKLHSAIDGKTTMANAPSYTTDDDECDRHDDYDIGPHYVPPAVICPLFVTWSKLSVHRHHRHRCHLSDERRNSLPTPVISNEDDDNIDDDDGRSYDLRGCMGTLSSKLSLETSLSQYAMTSAFNDSRFDPIYYDELPYLRVSVSLLVNYEECANCHDWIVGVHGIIIEFVVVGGGTTMRGGRDGNVSDSRTRCYTATYLPEVAHDRGWDQEEAVLSLIRKSGYRGEVTSRLLSDVRCTRYRSSVRHASYREYYHRAASSSGGDDERRRRRRRGRARVRRVGAGMDPSSTRDGGKGRVGGGGGGRVEDVDVDVDDDGRMTRRKSRMSTGSLCVNL